jgi:hypothetical protein
MRSVGISSAGISADIDGAEDILDTDPAPEDGGEGTPPESVTGEVPGGQAAPADQTV